jgi:CheY-like chemotaxis protein
MTLDSSRHPTTDMTIDPTLAATARPGSGATRCVLVVEDEVFLATLIEELLITAGYRVVKASRVDAALDLLRGGASFDAALLDINLNGVEVFPIAARLRALGVPFVFASGYGRQGLPPAFADSVVVQKPYLPEAITAALAHSLAAANPA